MGWRAIGALRIQHPAQDLFLFGCQFQGPWVRPWPDMAQFLQPNQQLAGYEVLELVGKGGMGEVYRARQLSMDRIVALKVLNMRQARQDPSFAKNFVEEARAAGRLSNANIISVHDVGSATLPGSPEEVYYFSMELIDGETLKDVIKREGTCPEKLIATIMSGMSEALVYAEKVGIIHRDIKPDNIMITSTKLVKLADLGLALQVGGEVVDEKDAQSKSKVMGTPMYMSPEQARALKLDHRCDQYSLGATLFHMLTGQPPYKGSDPKSVMRAHVFDPVPDPKTVKPDVPEAWRQLCMKLMAKAPEDRFATAADMKLAVQGAVHGVALSSLSKRVPRLSKRDEGSMAPWAKWAALAAAVAVVAVILVILGGNKRGGAGGAGTDGVVAQPEASATDAADAPLKAVIACLPADHAKALAQLSALVADPAWSTPRAKDMLAAEVKRRQAAVDASKREALKTELAAIDKRIADKDLSGAKEAIGALAAKRPEAAQQQPFKDVNAKLEAALSELANSFRIRIGAAASIPDVDAVAAESRKAPLSGDDASSLEKAAAKRRGELNTAAAAQASVVERKAWDKLALALDDKRRALKYFEIQAIVEAHAPGFPAESQEQLKALAHIGDLASAGEQALKHQIEGKRVDARIDDKPIKVQIVKWGLVEVQYLAIDAGGEQRKAERARVSVPCRDLLDQTPEHKEPDYPQIKAACLWMWRSADARAALEKIADQPLARGLKSIDRCLAGGLDVCGTVSRQGEQLTIAYDFSGKDQAMLVDFVGEGLGFGDHGLTWTTKKNVPKLSTVEADLPRVAWREALAPPFTVRAKLWMHPKTLLGLVGVETAGRRVRVSFSSGAFKSERMGVAFTAPDGAQYVNKEKTRSIAYGQLWDPAQPVEIELSMAEDGKVEASCEHVAAGSSPVAVLPTGSPITFVMQAYQFDGNETMLELQSLEITGKPIPKN